MFANKPSMAKRWAAHTPKGKKLPEHVKKAYEEGHKQAMEELSKTSGELGKLIDAKFPVESLDNDLARSSQAANLSLIKKLLGRMGLDKKEGIKNYYDKMRKALK